MIINFNIKNFGSIKEQQTLSFEAEKTEHLEDFYITKIGKRRILKIALIYGANASGKTTILKALDFLRDLVIEPENKKTDELDFQPFLFDEKSSKENTILSIEFIQNRIKYFYEVEFNKKAIVKETLKSFNPNKATVYKRTTDLKNRFSEIKFGGKIKVDKTILKTLEANTLWNNTVLGGYIKTNIEIKELKEVSDWFKDYLRSLVFPNSKLDGFITSLIDRAKIKKENVLTILKKADLNISNIIIDKEEKDIPEGLLEFIEKSSDIPDIELEKLKRKKKITSVKLGLEHLVDGQKYTLPFELESEGTKRYYSFAGLLNLLIKEQNAFPIDELGASLHPDLYQYFLLTFLANAKNSQIIATTHNRELLNDKDMIRDDMLWITDKSNNASTELYSFADFDSSIIRDTTNRLNAYKSGKLGGVPNVGDYYLELD
ncbi:MAG: ATP-binding protein [Chlorobi bacterium]|nr:ATP-binding protein [Chlorobiota bacterium]